jgi:tRNA (guanine37-N1)-methyltransferase
MLTFTVITIFPQMFASTLGHSILKRAQEKNLLKINLVDLRDYTTDKHKMTDDYPYGGGQGMVMKPEPLVAAIEDARKRSPKARVILLAPQGRVFKQSVAQRMASENEIVLLCGRYEGIDERVKAFIDEEISVGDYTLSGGEPAANIVIDAVARLIPGVLGNEHSAADESFSDGLLEYPQYTRPEEFRGMKVPDVLLSGDHQRVKDWRQGSGRIAGPRATISACSIACRSSRTLPCHGRRCNSASVWAVNRAGRSFEFEESDSVKYAAKSAMSSRRSPSAGNSI